jgi:quercetin dioxygenase-like cupin family protein
MKNTTEPRMLPAVAMRAGEGEARWWFGSLAEIKLTAEQSGGLVSIVEITEPPFAEAPLHVHHREDEGFWVLDGTVRFEVGGREISAGPGDFAFGPKDVPHRYTVGEGGCRMLFILTPGGFENAIVDMSTPARERTLPPPGEQSPDPSGMKGTIVAYGCEMVGW